MDARNAFKFATGMEDDFYIKITHRNSERIKVLLLRLDSDHHRPEFLEDYSVLENAGIGMVLQFVVEAMHAIDLGPAFKIINAIIKNQTISRLSKTAFDAMNTRFLSFRQYTPSEFERKPRTLEELVHFKANELRQLLSYTLPVLLKGFVSEELLQQVLLLHCAVRLLQDPNSYRENANAARHFLQLFVANYSATFGQRNFTYKTHNALHIPDDVVKYGPLYSISAYKAENHLRYLRALLRKQDLHLQQVSNRLSEISFAESLRDAPRQSNDFQYNNFTLKPNSLRDGCSSTVDGVAIVITRLTKDNGERKVFGRRFLRCESFFEYPVSSMDSLGIVLASDLSILEEEFSTNTIGHKYYRLPYEEKFVLIPIIHTS